MDNLVVLMFTFSLCGAIIYLHSICISKLRRWDAKKAQQQQAVQLDYDQRKREQAQLREELAQRQRVVWEEQARQAQCERAVREQQRLAQLSSLQDLYNLTSQVFETEVAQMFRRLGWTVHQTPFSNDRGRDAIMTNGNDKVLLECKKYAPEQMSGRPELQKFHSAIVTDHAERGKFVTTSGFSLAAREYVTANNLPIDLIDGPQLLQLFAASRGETSRSPQATRAVPPVRPAGRADDHWSKRLEALDQMKRTGDFSALEKYFGTPPDWEHRRVELGRSHKLSPKDIENKIAMEKATYNINISKRQYQESQEQ